MLSFNQHAVFPGRGRDAKWTVALVDGAPLFCYGLEIVLRLEPDLEVVGAAGTAAQARVLVAKKPSLIILDVTLADASGVDLAREIMIASPTTRVLILTGHTDERVLAEVLDAGVDGLALKTQPLDELLGAIRGVARGDTYRPACYAHLAAGG
jgi:DNA-binding NarL/FixJ family response regulator